MRLKSQRETVFFGNPSKHGSSEWFRDGVLLRDLYQRRTRTTTTASKCGVVLFTTYEKRCMWAVEKADASWTNPGWRSLILLSSSRTPVQRLRVEWPPRARHALPTGTRTRTTTFFFLRVKRKSCLASNKCPTWISKRWLIIFSLVVNNCVRFTKRSSFYKHDVLFDTLYR